jgi:hypothetical protein
MNLNSRKVLFLTSLVAMTLFASLPGCESPKITVNRSPEEGKSLISKNKWMPLPDNSYVVYFKMTDYAEGVPYIDAVVVVEHYSKESYLKSVESSPELRPDAHMTDEKCQQYAQKSLKTYASLGFDTSNVESHCASSRIELSVKRLDDNVIVFLHKEGN